MKRDEEEGTEVLRSPVENSWNWGPTDLCSISDVSAVSLWKLEQVTSPLSADL